MNFWRGLRVAVTGGCSPIGSHLITALVEREARVTAVDNLSIGQPGYISEYVSSGLVTLVRADLMSLPEARGALGSAQVVFHLAAQHGGRGFVDRYQARTAQNFGIDAVTFQAAVDVGVERIFYASSACVYPQNVFVLSENHAGPPSDADNIYGWSKLMGEFTLRTLHQEYGIDVGIARFFTVYGPRSYETHAIIAMIARARARQDPYIVWGTGQQIRNWTYVSDIVSGALAVAEKITDATPVNIGTDEQTRVLDAVRLILDCTGFSPTIETRPDLPSGPHARVADISRARDLLGWSPVVSFADGVQQTINWYFATKSPDDAKRALEAHA